MAVNVRKEGMGSIADETKPRLLADPGRQWVTVHELPVDTAGCLLPDGSTTRVVSLDDLEHILNLSRERPGLFDVGVVSGTRSVHLF